MPTLDADGKTIADGWCGATAGPLTLRLNEQEAARFANPPPVPPLRRTCARHGCGVKAEFIARDPVQLEHQAAQWGGRLDRDASGAPGAWFCSARCVPPNPDAPDPVRDLVRATPQETDR